MELKGLSFSWANIRKKAEPPKTKRCSKCGRELPLTEFYPRKDTKDGVQSRCKECDKAHGRLRNGTTGKYKKEEETLNIIDMNDIQIFNNPQFGDIRTTGTPDTPLFCAADICKALGYSNGRKAVADHCDEGDVTKRDTLTAGGMQSVTFVNESGLYALIFGSKLESAKQFKQWVTSEVLPAIRKTGGYLGGDDLDDEQIMARALMVAQNTINRKNYELEQARKEKEQLEAKREEDKPKVVYAEAVAGSKSSCLIGELAKMISQNGYQIGEKRLFAWLRENHYLCSYGERYNLPYQQYIEQGLFTLKQNVFSVNGEMMTRNTTKVTGKGQIYFINIFLGKKGNDDESNETL